MSPNTRRMLLAALAAALAGCAAVPTAREAGLTAQASTRWRDRALWRGDDLFVLAAGDRAAAEAAEMVARARRALVEHAGRGPARGVVVAYSVDDALLADDAESHVAALQRWHAAAVGGHAPQRAGFGRRRDGSPAVDPALMARMLTVALPPADGELALPPELAAAPWAVLLPTRSCLVAIATAMFEAGLEHGDVGFLQRQLARAVVDVEDLVDQQLMPLVYEQLLRTWEAAGELPRERRDAVYAALDLDPPRGGDDPPPERLLAPLSPEEAERVLRSLPGFAADDALGIAVVRTPDHDTLRSLRALDWALAVDLDPLVLTRAHPTGDAVRFEHMPERRYLPGRDAAERLEALRRRFPGRTLVLADDASRAAALWAQHAFWVRGASADDAMALARRFGLHDALASAVRETLAR